jgi:RimJ/RimL family protein N-acetyltransferase
MIRLLSLSPSLADAAREPNRFAVLTGVRIADVAEQVRVVAQQDAAHRARVGWMPEWGGFLAIDDARQQVVGIGGYVAAPDRDGAVEIAYGTFVPYEGQSYATQIAGALIAQAADSGAVRCVYAHTLPNPNASTRILQKHGFVQTGTAHDPDEGLVWRWELEIPPRGDWSSEPSAYAAPRAPARLRGPQP